ncbi:MAG: hypothetical protein ACYCZB_13690 [Acidiphilium sp.]
MQRPAGILFVAVVGGLCLAGPAAAQTSSNRPTSSGVAQQFKSGANHVGTGAVQIGEGIKQGAIVTWEAIRDGASAAATRFDGYRSPSHGSSAQSTRQSR